MTKGRPLIRTTTCEWCKRSFTAGRAGRMPRFCGESCRDKAWRAGDTKSDVQNAAEVEARLAFLVAQECAMPWEKAKAVSW